MGDCVVQFEEATRRTIEALHGRAILATVQMVQEGEFERAKEWFGCAQAYGNLLNLASENSEHWERLEPYQQVSKTVRDANDIIGDQDGPVDGIGIQ